MKGKYGAVSLEVLECGKLRTVSFVLHPLKNKSILLKHKIPCIWIWIIHAMIAKWLHYTIELYFTSWYYVQTIYRPWKNKQCRCLEGASRKLIRGCSENRKNVVMHYFQVNMDYQTIDYWPWFVRTCFYQLVHVHCLTLPKHLSSPLVLVGFVLISLF